MNEQSPNTVEAASANSTATQSAKSKQRHPGIAAVKRFGWVCFFFGFVGFAVLSNSVVPVSTSPQAAEALKTGVAVDLKTGTRLAREETAAEPRDVLVRYPATEAHREQIELVVWDYAAEDGDYIQIVVDGEPASAAFVLKNKPVSITVPMGRVFEIVGVRDGGGGVTYAVRWKPFGQTHVNTAPVGSSNRYTLTQAE